MSQQTAPQASSATKWASLLAVTMAFTFTFICRFIWSPLMNPVSEEFGFGAAQAGLYMSAFFAGYLITQIPGGIMADKLQPKYILIICAVLGGAMTAAMATITSYEMGLVFRVITGVSSGCVMSSCSKVVAVNFAPSERATAMGILLASPPIGITIANLIGPPLRESLNWRGTFIATGALAAVVVLLVLVFVKPVPKAPAKAGGSGMLSGLKSYFSDKNQLIIGASGFMFMAVSVGFATWCNTYAQNKLSLTPAQGGLVITLYSIAGIVGSCLSGSISKALKMSHKQFLIVSLSGIAVFTILFSMQTSHTGLILVGVIYGFFSYLPSTHYTTLCMIMADDSYAATAVSSQNLVFQTSSMIQPAVIGAMLDATGNYSLIWYAFAGCIAIAVLLCLLLPGSAKKN